MNAVKEIKIANLQLTQLRTESLQSSSVGKKNNPEVEQNLFQFKQTLIRLIKEDYTQVIITNKTKKISDAQPYYQIIVSKNHLVIKDMVGDTTKRTLTYQWNSLNVTVNGQPGEMTMINDYFQKMITDMDNNNVELCYERN